MLILFFYAFVSNVALAVVPHEPVVIWYGAQVGIWLTAAIATVGTVTASWVDHRVFVPVFERVSSTRPLTSGLVATLHRWFGRAPFAVIAISGLTPLPFWPFKAMAFAAGYPLGRYLAAVAAGRFPRYLLLAWLGLVINIPTWVLGAAFIILLLPSLRLIPWQRQSAN
jgi:membrane protein YqaA with SNARE-associated domain